MDHPFWHIAASAHDELCINLPSGIFLSASFSSFQACISGSGYRPHSWLLHRRWVPSCGDREIFLLPTPFSCLDLSMTYTEPRYGKVRITVLHSPLYRDGCLLRH